MVDTNVVCNADGTSVASKLTVSSVIAYDGTDVALKETVSLVVDVATVPATTDGGGGGGGTGVIEELYKADD